MGDFSFEELHDVFRRAAEVIERGAKAMTPVHIQNMGGPPLNAAKVTIELPNGNTYVVDATIVEVNVDTTVSIGNVVPTPDDGEFEITIRGHLSEGAMPESNDPEDVMRHLEERKVVKPGVPRHRRLQRRRQDDDTGP